MTELPHLLYATEAGELLRLHPVTIRRMIDRHEVRGVKIGGRWRIPREDVLAMLAAVQ